MEDIEKLQTLSTRSEIKERFRNGMIPSEEDFSCLVDSMVNIKEDGFSKKNKEGFVIYSAKQSGQYLTLYKSTNDELSFFVLENENTQNDYCLKLGAGEIYNSQRETTNNNGEDNAFYFHLNGKLGIGKKSSINLKMDVAGLVGMQGRIGTFKKGRVLADRKWHKILTGLDGCRAFEIMARAGRKGSGKFGMLHALALSTYGNSKNVIRKTSAYYGYFWNKLSLRWTGSTNNYNLELRSNSNYTDNIGDGKVYIDYTIMSLWDDQISMDDCIPDN